jgi:hypothetical protein
MSGTLIAIGGGILLWAMASGLEIRWVKTSAPDQAPASAQADERKASLGPTEALPLEQDTKLPLKQEEELEKQLTNLMAEEARTRTVIRPGRSRDVCLAESNGIVNEKYLRCRTGWEEQIPVGQ